MPKKLLAEGLVRDVVRRMQEMRRQLDLPVDAYVSAYIVSHGKVELESLRGRKDYIAEEVRAKRLRFLKKIEKRPSAELWKTWLIDGKDFTIGLQRMRIRGASKKGNPAKRAGSKRHSSR
jgi:isoleucyl-tRNA synthetase